MLHKIDLRQVIADHYRTLHDNRSGAHWPDALLFGAVPIIIGVGSVVADVRLRDTGSLLAAVSVLAGLLFALLVMLLQMAGTAAERMEDHSKQPTERNYRRIAVLREMSANIAYAVLISVLCTLLLGIGELTLREVPLPVPTGGRATPTQPLWFTVVSISALLHLVLTLLMVLKRTYTLLTRELDYGSVPVGRG